ncbi:MAG: hypothetical protein WC549_00125 [Actinomycetota bacterium]
MKKKNTCKTHWVTKLGKSVNVELLDSGPAVQHNLMCWLCNEEKAVYDMNPNWVFRPCWDCQARLGLHGVVEIKKKKWWEIWKT